MIAVVGGWRGMQQVEEAVRLDRADLAEALRACALAIQRCHDVEEQRRNLGERVSDGWEGRARDGFDVELAELLGGLDEGRVALSTLRRVLLELGAEATGLQREIDERNERQARTRRRRREA